MQGTCDDMVPFSRSYSWLGSGVKGKGSHIRGNTLGVRRLSIYNSPNCATSPADTCSSAAVYVTMLDTTYLRSSMAAILSVLSSSSTDAFASFPFLKFQIYPFCENVVVGLILTSIHSALDCLLNYSRNYMATLLPSCIRTIVYLDSNLILVDDIAKLATTSLRDHILVVPKYCNANFIAYFTLSFWLNPLLSLTFAGCRCKPCYFIIGMMVIDLQRWRADDYSTKIQEWIDLQKRMSPFLLVFAGNIAPTDHSWSLHRLGGDNFRWLKEEAEQLFSL
ncbi:hypothetical protein Fmac_005583 [Flemingia macrophylla]|uniref:Hexosyltransferase n=1 Tax=Flemingia macrophylla TaxID=520843 RepID=A0ABD1N9I6_9FABA